MKTIRLLSVALCILFSLVGNAQWVDNADTTYTFDKVGIGTASPLGKLHIKSNIADHIIFEREGNTRLFSIGHNGSNGTLLFSKTSGSQPAGTNTIFKFLEVGSVWSDNAFWNGFQLGGHTVTKNGVTRKPVLSIYTGSSTITEPVDYEAIIGLGNMAGILPGGIGFSAPSIAGSYLRWGFGDAPVVPEAMRITYDGTNTKLGLGTTTPTSKFDVQTLGSALPIATFSSDMDEIKDSTITFSAGGKLGIGTASPDTTSNLHIKNATLPVKFLLEGAYTGTSNSPISTIQMKNSITGDYYHQSLRRFNGVDEVVQSVYKSSLSQPWLGITKYGINDGTYVLESGITNVLFRNTGNIGVGTSSPTSKLDIQTLGSTLPIATFSSDKDEIKDSTITFSAGGNIGIGITNPLSKLHVASVGSATIGSTITVENKGGIGGAGFNMIDSISGGYWTSKVTGAGDFKIRDIASALDVFVIQKNASANALYIKAGGNVGIGTAAPTTKLNIIDSINPVVVCLENPYNGTPVKSIGAFIIRNSTTGDKADYELRRQNGFSEMILSGYDSLSNTWRSFSQLNITTGKYEIRNGVKTTEFLNTGDVLFNNTGKVGIGTTTPLAKLDVKESTALGGTLGNSQLISRMQGVVGNSFQNNMYLLRDAAGNDWFTARWHDAIGVDVSFQTPGVNTKTWWERDPANNIQSWGNDGSTYMTINAGKVGIGTITPTTNLDVVGTGKFTGTVTAANATLPTELVTKAQLDATSNNWIESNQIIKPKTAVALELKNGTDYNLMRIFSNYNSSEQYLLLESEKGNSYIVDKSGSGIYISRWKDVSNPAKVGIQCSYASKYFFPTTKPTTAGQIMVSSNDSILTWSSAPMGTVTNVYVGYGLSAVRSSGDITISLKLGNSLNFDQSENIQLKGDVFSSGNDYYYGTNSQGTKGWYSLPTGSGSGDINSVIAGNGLLGGNTSGDARLDVNTQNSIQITNNALQFFNDVANPLASQYYGTNSSGTKGWYNLPAGGLSDNWGTQVVQHDASLTGTGIAGNLLGVANNGITTAKIANNSITPDKISISGASNNNVLKFSSTTNSWYFGIDETTSGGTGDGNNYPISLTFSDGILTLGRSGMEPLTKNLDGRYLTTEVDGDVSNEIQTLSISGNTISLTRGGGSVIVPTGGLSTVSTDGTIITGNGTSALPIRLANGTANNQTLKWDASTSTWGREVLAPWSYSNSVISYSGGTVKIGPDTPSGIQDILFVNGRINSQEVVVQNQDWFDFVFNDDYQLKTLSEVENYIKENKHLPDIPSEKEVKENGVNLGEMNALLLKKIEELTLYNIEMEKRISELEKKINNKE